MKSKIRGTPYFLKDFISKELENIKDSLIIAVIEEGTPKNIYDHNYKDLQNNCSRNDKGHDQNIPPWLTLNNGTSKGDFNNSF